MKAEGDLGGRANAGGIHQNLTPEEADEIGKGKQAGDSWGVVAKQQRTREGATKQIGWNAESRDANGSESAAMATSGNPSRIIRQGAGSSQTASDSGICDASRQRRTVLIIHVCTDVHYTLCRSRARSLGRLLVLSLTSGTFFLPGMIQTRGNPNYPEGQWEYQRQLLLDFVQIWTVTDSLHPSKGGLGFHQGGGFHGNR